MLLRSWVHRGLQWSVTGDAIVTLSHLGRKGSGRTGAPGTGYPMIRRVLIFQLGYGEM
jgi:hypothetical protein